AGRTARGVGDAVLGHTPVVSKAGGGIDRTGVGDGAAQSDRRPLRTVARRRGTGNLWRRGDVVDGQRKGGRVHHAEVVGRGDGHGCRVGGTVGRGVRPCPSAGVVVAGHRAQRGGQRHGTASLGVVEVAGVAGDRALVVGHGRLSTGNSRGIVLDLE